MGTKELLARIRQWDHDITQQIQEIESLNQNSKMERALGWCQQFFIGLMLAVELAVVLMMVCTNKWAIAGALALIAILLLAKFANMTADQVD